MFTWILSGRSPNLHRKKEHWLKRITFAKPCGLSNVHAEVEPGGTELFVPIHIAFVVSRTDVASTSSYIRVEK